jgi:hypothetical protein
MLHHVTHRRHHLECHAHQALAAVQGGDAEQARSSGPETGAKIRRGRLASLRSQSVKRVSLT